jgi:hypothetical protein
LYSRIAHLKVVRQQTWDFSLATVIKIKNENFFFSSPQHMHLAPHFPPWLGGRSYDASKDDLRIRLFLSGSVGLNSLTVFLLIDPNNLISVSQKKIFLLSLFISRKIKKNSFYKHKLEG